MRHLMRLLIPAMLVLPFLVACGTAPASEAPLTCTAGAAASADWIPASSRTSTTPSITSASVSGDTLTLTFDRGTPAFEVKPQSSGHFTETNGRGGPVDLSGSAGVLILLHGFRGDIQNYAGPLDMKSGGARLLEVRMIGDFEGTVGWAAGLNAPSCANITASGSTLTIRFTSQPS